MYEFHGWVRILKDIEPYNYNSLPHLEIVDEIVSELILMELSPQQILKGWETF